MRVISENLTEGLKPGRRQTRLGLTGVEADARPRRQASLIRLVSFLWNRRAGIWQVRTSQAGIGSNNSLKQKAGDTSQVQLAFMARFCLARIR